MTQNRWALTTVLLLGATGACAPDLESEAAIGETAALYGGGAMAGTLARRPGADLLPAGSDTPNLAVIRDRFRVSAEDSWARVSAVRLSWEGTCTSTNPRGPAQHPGGQAEHAGVGLGHGLHPRPLDRASHRDQPHGVVVAVPDLARGGARPVVRARAAAPGRLQSHGRCRRTVGVPIRCVTGASGDFTPFDTDSVVYQYAGLPRHLSPLDVAGVQAAYGVPTRTTARCCRTPTASITT